MPGIFWIWMAAAVLFLIVELAMPTMIFVSFVVGALVAGTFSYFQPEAHLWQIGLFVIVSLIILPFSQKLAGKISKESPQVSNVDRMIGQVALVTREIDPDLGGHVIFEGETWQARSDERILNDQKVRIVSVTGTRVNVEPLRS